MKTAANGLKLDMRSAVVMPVVDSAKAGLSSAARMRWRRYTTSDRGEDGRTSKARLEEHNKAGGRLPSLLVGPSYDDGGD